MSEAQVLFVLSGNLLARDPRSLVDCSREEVVYASRFETVSDELKRVRDDNARLRRALAAIVKYGDKGIHGNDGICPFGCDCPHIAQAALDGGKGVQGGK